MQITISHIADIEPDTRAAEALRVGYVAHPESVEQAMLRAYQHLEERYAAVPVVGTEDFFGDIQTADTWGYQVRDINDALVRIRFIARSLGVNSLADE